MRIAPEQQASIVLFVLRNEDGDLFFLTHPDVREIVLTADLGYIDALLKDFIERARTDPGALFKQILSLGVGPLAHRESGSDLSEFPALQELAAKFVKLEG